MERDTFEEKIDYMKTIFRNNGLSIVLFSVFFFSLVCMSIAGLINYNESQAEHGEALVSYTEYIVSGNFMEALTENMESEFLQIYFYVLLTAFLFQKGSAESKDPDKPEENDTEPKHDSPWPVKKGGIYLKIYQNSLSMIFLFLFVIAFILHGISGAADFNEEQITHGAPPISCIAYFISARFWFESFQNWQSEFFSIGAVVVFSIFLRQKNSPESKKVNAPHSETGR